MLIYANSAFAVRFQCFSMAFLAIIYASPFYLDRRLPLEPLFLAANLCQSMPLAALECFAMLIYANSAFPFSEHRYSYFFDVFVNFYI